MTSYLIDKQEYLLHPVESGISTTRCHSVRKFSVVVHVLQLAVFRFISNFLRMHTNGYVQIFKET